MQTLRIRIGFVSPSTGSALLPFARAAVTSSVVYIDPSGKEAEKA
jgi:hypothetical protein